MRRFFEGSGQADPVDSPFHWALSRPEHAVQFYDSSDSPSRIVADYLADGLAAGQPVIAIATLAHVAEIESEFSDRELDVPMLRATGQLTLLEAESVLDAIIVDGMPDARRFRAIVRPEFDRIARRGRLIRVFGEAVDVLCQRGQPEAAVGLEDQWNRLGAAYDFAIMCGYSLDHFRTPGSGAVFEHICGQHSRVIAR